MPSDPRMQRALAALEPQRTQFRTAVAAVHDQVRGYLATHGALARDRREESLAELGRFAAGRLDAARFADIAAERRVLPPPAEAIVRQCADVLQDVLERGDQLHVVEIAPGGDMRAAVDAALAEAGRAFGAVLAFQAVKTGSYCTEHHQPALRAFPYARWNRTERQLGVPLVIRASGADVRAEALAEYLDGRQQIVLVLDAPCPPAPLARLLSPGVLVLQAEDDLAPLARAAGPAMAALVPSEAARFVHDPAATPRLVVQRLPAAPKKAAGRWSSWQQREQLALLEAMAQAATPVAAPAVAAVATPVAAVPAGVAVAAVAPVLTGVGASDLDEPAVSALTGWLLAHAGLAEGRPQEGGVA